MNIQTITYRRHKNLGNYENETIEVTGFVSEGDDPKVVLNEIRAFVEDELQIRESLKSLKSEKYVLRAELTEIETKLKLARNKWDLIQDALTKAGTDLNLEDLPF